MEKTASAAAAKAIKNNQDAVKLFMEKTIQFAYGYLQEYMKVFAGEDEANKIQENDVQVTYVPDDLADPYGIPSYKARKYQIPALDDEKSRDMVLAQLEKNPSAKEYKLYNMCFKIAYKLVGAK